MHITAKLAARAVKRKNDGPPIRRRVTLAPFRVDRLSIPVGRHYKGQWDYLRRVLKMRRSRVTFVYANSVATTGALLLSNFPLEARDDLVGCYTGTGLTTAMLKEDLAAAGALQ